MCQEIQASQKGCTYCATIWQYNSLQAALAKVLRNSNLCKVVNIVVLDAVPAGSSTQPAGSC